MRRGMDQLLQELIVARARELVFPELDAEVKKRGFPPPVTRMVKKQVQNVSATVEGETIVLQWPWLQDDSLRSQVMSIVKGGHFSPATKMMSPLPITREAKKKKDFFCLIEKVKKPVRISLSIKAHHFTRACEMHSLTFCCNFNFLCCFCMK